LNFETLQPLWLGEQQNYQAVLKLQRDLFGELVTTVRSYSDRSSTDNTHVQLPQYILGCSHTPTITLGKGAKQDNLLLNHSQFADLGIELVDVERGGDVTYHGPEQLVIYPLIHLGSPRKSDVGWYVRGLEQCIIDLLKIYRIDAVTIPEKTGVWVKNRASSQLVACEQKIAFIGIKLSRWCTMHGISVNIYPCQKQFNTIRGCGFTDLQVTSLSELREDLTTSANTHTNLFASFEQIFLKFVAIFREKFYFASDGTTKFNISC
jgi:lipoyl(octanoyl) transferase